MEDTLVILVDKNDNPLGTMEKMEAHRKALLHRAVSVFIVNTKGDWLLQQRAHDKYHSGCLWTNACCTHPYPGESVLEAARRRLTEEMGIQCELRELFDFIYKEKLDNELTEYELDHVFIGYTDALPHVDKQEVAGWKSIPYHELENDVLENPSGYTVWFKKVYQKVHHHILNH